ncbi:MAG: UDP-forming cellulose synthase catalytic subunit [Panacagrimonas sp.]
MSRARSSQALRQFAARSLGVPADAPTATWIEALFFLPPDQARPLPTWLSLLLAPFTDYAARHLGVRRRESPASWLAALFLFRLPSHAAAQALPRLPLLNWAHGFARAIGAVLWVLMLPMKLLERLLDRLHFDKPAGGLSRIAQTVMRMPRWVSVPVVLLTGFLLLVCATTPLGTSEQLLLFLLMWLSALVLRRLPGNVPTLILVAFSLIASSRYIWWRLTQTLGLDPGLELFFGLGLIAAETYAWLILLLGYIQNAWPLDRKPVPLPQDTALWPTVDVFVPTYNEPLRVVKPTVLAALSMDWPRDKLRVHILDDGRRPEFRAFAQQCGVDYRIRPDNAHAKAGNLNYALKHTDGEFVAIFDCDHIPTRSFLQTTMGWMLKDPKCAMLQTPHHFFSPDPFERNLGTFRRVPNEGSLFYGLVQDGNDLWNATFFCGSCAVLRRKPLLEVGGIAVETVTEDAHTALKMHRRGYNTAYIKLTQAAGLATESLSGHIGQRIRWARGMAQILRVDNPLFGRGLSLYQRLCYSNAMLHFFYGLPRLVFLTAPLAYLFGEFHIIDAAAPALAVYVLPHLFQAAVANSRLQGQYRHSFWAEAYESVLAWYIAWPTTLALINPKLGTFNVTAKGGLVERSYFDWKISGPYILLMTANLVGLIVGIVRLFWWNAHEPGTVLLNLLWTVYNLTMLGAAIGVAAEARQVRVAHRVPMRVPATVLMPDGSAIACRTDDYSIQGLELVMPDHQALERGTAIQVVLGRGEAEYAFPARIVGVRGDRVGIQFETLSIEQETNLIRCTFGRADAWLDWDEETETDRPISSLAEVLRFGGRGYLRLLEGAVQSMRERFRSPSTAAAS